MYKINCVTSFDLGSQSDDEKTIEINFSEWFAEHGYLELQLWHERADGTIYQAQTVQNNEVLSWTVTAYDREVVGEGRCQFVGVLNELKVKSKIYPSYVRR